LFFPLFHFIAAVCPQSTFERFGTLEGRALQWRLSAHCSHRDLTDYPKKRSTRFFSYLPSFELFPFSLLYPPPWRRPNHPPSPKRFFFLFLSDCCAHTGFIATPPYPPPPPYYSPPQFPVMISPLPLFGCSLFSPSGPRSFLQALACTHSPDPLFSPSPFFCLPTFPTRPQKPHF